MSDPRDDPEPASSGGDKDLGEVFALVLGSPPIGLSREEELLQLREGLIRIRDFARGLSEGDLRQELDVRGSIAGPLKALASNLRHLTWQAGEIAAGDLSQRVDFLGEFSAAFNEMAGRLDATLRELRARELELNRTNDSLRVAQVQLVEQATRDPLTGLLNRRSLAERWAAERAWADRSAQTVAVMAADLDKFKSVNDTWGHEAGDIVLVSFAETLGGVLRASDIAFRVGGDEFLVLLPGTASKAAMGVAGRICDAFAHADLGSELAGCEHSVSFGVAEYPNHGRELDDLIRSADEALYEVKAGRQYRVAAAG